MTFEILSSLDVTLKSVNISNECHGDEDVTRITCGVKVTVPNTFLDLIDPTLRPSLYMAVPDQEQLPGVEPATPLLRCRSYEKIHLKQCYEGWTLEIAHGIDESDPIKLGDTKADKFVLAPKEGGSVDIAFRLGSNDIDATEIGLICAKLAQEISIRLTAPVKADASVIDGSTAAFKADHPDASDLFTAGASDQPAGDFDQADDDSAGPGTGSSDDARHDDGAADSEGGETDARGDEAEFEAGAKAALEKAGVAPRGTRKTRAVLQ